MKIRTSNNYGWERPDLMHKNSVMWHSRLRFILKELQFLNTLLNENIYHIVESNLAAKSEELIEQLVVLKKEVSELLYKIHMHINGVKILFDKQNKSENGWGYKHEHRKIMIKMHEFDSKYQCLKKEIFKVITEALKHQKQKRIASQ